MKTELLFITSLLVVLFLPPVLLLGQLMRSSRLAGQSSRWARAQGFIEDSGITAQNSGPKGGLRKYFARVRYAYEVDGATLHSSAIWLPGQHETGTFDEAEVLAERYSVGSRVTVFFDPRHPELAVLEPGSNGGLCFTHPRRLWMFALVPALVLFFFVIEWLAHLAG
jgi:hypothetical protein